MNFSTALFLSVLEPILGVGLFFIIVFGGYSLLRKKFNLDPSLAGGLAFIIFVVVNLIIQETTGLQITGR